MTKNITIKEVVKLNMRLSSIRSLLIKVSFLFSFIRNQIQPLEMNTSGPEYIHDLFTINVQRYAAFCKNIPEYCQLGEEDQIALFKGCITEASLLRSAQSYAEHPGEFKSFGS